MRALAPKSGLALHLALVATLAVIHAAAVSVGSFPALRYQTIAAVWPGSGIIFAAFMLLPRRWWPVWALATIAIETFHFRHECPTLTLNVAIAAGNALEGAIGAFLTRRFTARHAAVSTLRGLLTASLAAVILAPALNATFAMGVLELFDRLEPGRFWPLWRVFFIGDSTGVLIVGFGLLSLVELRASPWSWGRRLELAALILTTLAVQIFVFSRSAHLASAFHPLTYLVLPFLFWGAVRHGLFASCLVAGIVSLVSIGATQRDLGPFAHCPEDERLVVLQSFIAAGAILGHALAVTIDQRRAAESRLQQRNRLEKVLFLELDHRVRNNLASLLTLIDLTRRGTTDVDDFGRIIEGRVRAMAAVHTLLAKSQWRTIRLLDLIRRIKPQATPALFEFAGPDLSISPRQASAAALVLHDLFAAAMRRGPGLNPAGEVRLSWTEKPGPAGTTDVEFSWIESGPPALPDARPFAETDSIIEGLIASELAGTSTLAYPGGNAEHRMTWRLDAVASVESVEDMAK